MKSYCRALRVGNVIRVSGTTAHPPPLLASSIGVLGGACARCQATAVLDIIARAVRKLGGTMAEVVRTRVMIRKEEHCEAVSLAHGWAFACEKIRPSNTLVVAGLIGDDMLVEIEAEAVVGGSGMTMVLTD